MNFDWNILVSLLAGIATCIPLVIKLVQFIQTAVKEKNWANLMTLVTKYMIEAETLFSTGADRKTWVMNMIEQSAVSVNYDLTDEAKQKIGDMIDAMCSMAKVVNTP